MNYREMISAEKIALRVQELGKQINDDYESSGGELLIVGLLRGSFIFMADLVRAISYFHEVDFMTASSYGNSAVSSGDVKIVMDLNKSITGKHVLLVDDVITTGSTIESCANELLKAEGVKVSVAALAVAVV